jgi:hypothetical protein
MFTGNEDNEITLQEGVDLTKQYQQLLPGSVKGVYISKSSLETILAQTDAVGVRIYFSMTASLAMTAVLVAVKANGNDLSAGVILDKGITCPPVCDVNSPFLHDI